MDVDIRRAEVDPANISAALAARAARVLMTLSSRSLALYRCSRPVSLEIPLHACSLSKIC
ncbi:MAG: hypothetical protein ACXWLB_02685 [Reyranella sp.]